MLDKARQASVAASGAAVVNNSTAQAVSVTTDKKDELIESKRVTDDTVTSALAKVEQRSYSIQVAMFNRKPNAEKYVNELQQIGFIAFLVSFTSSTGAEKYNVRLGPYYQRDQANENLALFKQSYSTSAYILTSK